MVKRALCVFLLVLLSVDVSFAQKINLQRTGDGLLYTDSLLNKRQSTSLFADDLRILDLELEDFNTNLLTVNTYLSYFASLEYLPVFHSVSERLRFYSLPVLSDKKAVMLSHLAIEDILKGHVSFAKKKLDAALFIYQLKRSDRQAALISEVLSKLNFLQRQQQLTALNNNIAVNVYENLGLNRELIDALFWKAKLLTNEGKYAEAEKLLLKKILMRIFRIDNGSFEMEAYYQLGKNYFIMQRYTESLWFLLQSKKLAEDYDIEEKKLQCYLMIAKLKVKAGNLSLALADLKEAEKLIQDKPAFQYYELDLSSQLAELYRVLGMKEDAQLYSLRFSQLTKEMSGS